MAEYAVVPASALRPKPESLSWDEAAAYPVAYLTAYVALVRCARIEPGEWLLVHGAAGGVGLATVDLAKALGRSEEHTSELQSLMRISYAVFCLKKQNNSIVTQYFTLC